MPPRQRAQRIRSRDVQVDGLAELSKALKEVGPEAVKELRKANRDVAKMVANDARAAAMSVGGVAAHVAPSIRPTAGATSAGVSIGGPAYPMAGGAEFGSIRFKQFGDWRGNQSDAGYFLYPSIRRDSERIVTEYTAALDDVLKKTGLR
jgi:hypothetical protein